MIPRDFKNYYYYYYYYYYYFMTYLILRSHLYHCVWSVMTAHSLTPEKRDNIIIRIAPHPLTPTSSF